mmetsp:Transcript_16318/g.49911  ORF Transcript_16318/g.49911 Transcript_16318/m.49911 type:complete len:224 (+) Transcript_16318:644-1315(+)
MSATTVLTACKDESHGVSSTHCTAGIRRARSWSEGSRRPPSGQGRWSPAPRAPFGPREPGEAMERRALRGGRSCNPSGHRANHWRQPSAARAPACAEEWNTNSGAHGCARRLGRPVGGGAGLRSRVPPRLASLGRACGGASHEWCSPTPAGSAWRTGSPKKQGTLYKSAGSVRGARSTSTLSPLARHTPPKACPAGGTQAAATSVPSLHVSAEMSRVPPTASC